MTLHEILASFVIFRHLFPLHAFMPFLSRAFTSS
uniref:Uncharacterized protein n=1 Tax=Rhizophora mucronata TaxID=61149 RepID=A0A2P2N9V0_RHIMU